MNNLHVILLTATYRCVVSYTTVNTKSFMILTNALCTTRGMYMQYVLKVIPEYVSDLLSLDLVRRYYTAVTYGRSIFIFFRYGTFPVCAVCLSYTKTNKQNTHIISYVCDADTTSRVPHPNNTYYVNKYVYTVFLQCNPKGFNRGDVLTQTYIPPMKDVHIRRFAYRTRNKERVMCTTIYFSSCARYERNSTTCLHRKGTGGRNLSVSVYDVLYKNF